MEWSSGWQVWKHVWRRCRTSTWGWTPSPQQRSRQWSKAPLRLASGQGWQVKLTRSWLMLGWSRRRLQKSSQTHPCRMRHPRCPRMVHLQKRMQAHRSGKQGSAGKGAPSPRCLTRAGAFLWPTSAGAMGNGCLKLRVSGAPCYSACLVKALICYKACSLYSRQLTRACAFKPRLLKHVGHYLLPFVNALSCAPFQP